MPQRQAGEGISHCNAGGTAVCVWLSMGDPEGQQQHSGTCTAQTQSRFDGGTASALLQAGVAADRKEGGDMQRRWSPGEVSAAKSRHDQLSFLIQRGVAR